MFDKSVQKIIKTLFVTKAIMVCGIWIGSGIGAFATKDASPFVVAFFATFFVLVWGNKIK